MIQPRVQAVGPGRFAIVSGDCAKDRTKWIMCDFYGKVLVNPTPVKHRSSDLKAKSSLSSRNTEIDETFPNTDFSEELRNFSFGEERPVMSEEKRLLVKDYS